MPYEPIKLPDRVQLPEDEAIQKSQIFKFQKTKISKFQKSKHSIFQFFTFFIFFSFFTFFIFFMLRATHFNLIFPMYRTRPRYVDGAERRQRNGAG